jgi:hypothetical protein
MVDSNIWSFRRIDCFTAHVCTSADKQTVVYILITTASLLDARPECTGIRQIVLCPHSFAIYDSCKHLRRIKRKASYRVQGIGYKKTKTNQDVKLCNAPLKVGYKFEGVLGSFILPDKKWWFYFLTFVFCIIIMKQLHEVIAGSSFYRSEIIWYWK